MKVEIKSASLMIVFILLAGCATATPGSKAAPVFAGKTQGIRAIVLLPPRIEVEQLSAGGVKEKMDDWTINAKNNTAAALEKELAKRPGLVVKSLSATSLPPALQANLEQTQALFDAVNASIHFHVYGPPGQAFPEKTSSDYSLGPEVGELAGQADAVLVFNGYDHIATAGRKALQAGMMVIGALGGFVVVPNLGATSLSAALVDARTGSVLWYNWAASKGGYDLRDPVSAASLVETVFKDFPLH